MSEENTGEAVVKENLTTEPAETHSADVRADVEKVYDQLSKESEGEEQGTKKEPKESKKEKNEPSQEQATEPSTDKLKEKKEEKTKKKEEEEVKEEAKDDDIKPPVRFSKKAKEVFAQLPKELKEEVANTIKAFEQDYTKKTNIIGAEQKKIAPITQTLESNSDIFEEAGIDPISGVQKLIQAQRLIQENPKMAYLKMLEADGLTVADLAEAVESGEYNSSNFEIQSLTKKVDQLMQIVIYQQEQQKHESMQKEYTSAVKEYENFKSEKDANGNLRFPFVEQIQDDFIRGITAIRQSNPEMSKRGILEQAYEQACWSNPQTRKELILQYLSDAESARAAKVKEEQENARRLNKFPRGGSGTPGHASSESNDVLSDVRRAYKELSSIG